MRESVEQNLVYTATVALCQETIELDTKRYLVTVADACIQMYVINWCKIFGAERNNPIHWKKYGYDSKVREYLLQEEQVSFQWHVSNRISEALCGTKDIEKISHDWECLCKWYQKHMASERGRAWINWFDRNYPMYASISEVKKIYSIIYACN